MARLCVGVEVATNGRASEARATCVRIGGMAEWNEQSKEREWNGIREGLCVYVCTVRARLFVLSSLRGLPRPRLDLVVLVVSSSLLCWAVESCLL